MKTYILMDSAETICVSNDIQHIKKSFKKNFPSNPRSPILEIWENGEYVNTVYAENVAKIIKVEMETAYNKKEIVIVKNENAFHGYEWKNNDYTPIFTVGAQVLFTMIRLYTNKGYTIRCLNKSEKNKLFTGITTFDDTVSKDHILKTIANWHGSINIDNMETLSSFVCDVLDMDEKDLANHIQQIKKE